jgi:hypothetical protein
MAADSVAALFFFTVLLRLHTTYLHTGKDVEREV